MTHTEIITILRPAGVVPHPSRYHHTDIDGDRLLISTALAPDGTPGLYFRTDPNGSAVPLADLPALIAQLQVIAEASQQEADEAERCDVEFDGGGRCAKPAGHRPPGSDDPHIPRGNR